MLVHTHSRLAKGRPFENPQSKQVCQCQNQIERIQNNVTRLSEKTTQLAEQRVLSKPKKERRKNFPLRLSLSERTALEAKAEQAGLKLSPYLRQAGLNKKISDQANRVSEINRATYVELGRIGNNINQMTKAAHQSLQRGMGCNIDPSELNDLLALLKKIRIEVLAVEPQEEKHGEMIAKQIKGKKL